MGYRTNVTTSPSALAAGVPGERYSFVYDSRSRRIGRTVEKWNTNTQGWIVEKSERFVYDQWNVVAVVDAAGEVVQRYAWGHDLSGTPQGAGGVGGLLAAADAASGRSWCYAYDGNGNVSAVVDLADGTKAGRYEYDAFGRTIASWGDEALVEVNGYRFSTKPLEGTGMYYYGFRYYQPETGRWLGRDPIGERGGVNLFGFVGNDGVNRGDFLGMTDIIVHVKRSYFEWDTLGAVTVTATCPTAAAKCKEVTGQTIELKKGEYSLVPQPDYRSGEFPYPVPIGNHSGEFLPASVTSINTLVRNFNSINQVIHQRQVQAYESQLLKHKKKVTIQVPSAFARRSPSCLGDRIKAVSVSSMGSDCFRALAMTLLRSQKALA